MARQIYKLGKGGTYKIYLASPQLLDGGIGLVD